MNNKIKYCVCICTFKRPTLLSRLIDDLLKQALLPEAIIVVDGDPNSNEVKGLLVEKQNHIPLANLYSCQSRKSTLSALPWF